MNWLFTQAHTTPPIDGEAYLFLLPLDRDMLLRLHDARRVWDGCQTLSEPGAITSVAGPAASLTMIRADVPWITRIPMQRVTLGVGGAAAQGCMVVEVDGLERQLQSASDVRLDNLTEAAWSASAVGVRFSALLDNVARVEGDMIPWGVVSAMCAELLPQDEELA